MAKISVIDQPVTSKNEDGVVRRRRELGNDNPDKLGTGEYAETLASFIRECDKSRSGYRVGFGKDLTT